jgi:hypothetical protein
MICDIQTESCVCTRSHTLFNIHGNGNGIASPSASSCPQKRSSSISSDPYCFSPRIVFLKEEQLCCRPETMVQFGYNCH